MGSGRASVGTRLKQGLATSVSGNAQAFGFSITITVSFGVIDVVHPSPHLLDLFLFALSAGCCLRDLERGGGPAAARR